MREHNAGDEQQKGATMDDAARLAFDEVERGLIADTINEISITIEDVQVHIHLYELLAITKRQTGDRENEIEAVKTVIANLKDIQATYRNNASVLAMTFGIKETT